MRAQILAALALGCAGACATLGTAPSHQLLERSYIAPKTSTDPTISYEALVAPHIFVWDDQRDVFRSLSQDSTPRTGGFRAIITPMFVIRQLKDSSSAVRTPSFMPRVSIEYFRAHRLKDTVIAGRPRFQWARLDAFRLTVAHHSDGQAGCFLEGQRPGKPGSFEADDCTPPPDTGFVRTNRANGDFSTTFLSFLVHDTFVKRGDGPRPAFVITGGLSYDWEVNFLPGQLPDIERQFYGSWRKRAQLEMAVADQPGCSDYHGWCLARGRTRLTGLYERAPMDLGPLAARLQAPIPHFRSYVELSHTFDALNGLGVFVRRVDGQDYYNIGFVNRRSATLYGLVLDLSGYETVR